MLPLFILSGLAALAQCAPATRHARVPINQDLKTLQAFAKTVTGPKDITSNWTRSGTDVCHWKGFLCNDAGTRVVNIDFNGFKLTGNIRLSGLLDKLTALVLFHANSNGFLGPLPDLSKSKEIYELDLSNNKLSGPFPSAIFSAPQLLYIDVRFNSLTGSLPGKVFTSFQYVQALFVNNNGFTGSLPAELGSFPGYYLNLANNKFTGSLPSTISNMPDILEIIILGNKLTGKLPSGLGKLNKLTTFDVSDNQLTGDVPEELCAIKTLQYLVLSGNKFNTKLGPNCQLAKKNNVLTM